MNHDGQAKQLIDQDQEFETLKWFKSQPWVGWQRIRFIQQFGEISLLALEVDILFGFTSDVFFDVFLGNFTTGMVHLYFNVGGANQLNKFNCMVRVTRAVKGVITYLRKNLIFVF